MPRLRRARLSDNAGVSYVDPSTGQHYPLTEARWCADNGHYLNLAPAPGLGRADIDASRHSVWRYAKALRVDSAHAVSLGEGGTPLVAGEWKGASVLYKLEFMMPTGSFKDRGMTVMVSYLKSRGIDRVLEDSSGNAGASLAAYAAAAGMRCRILVPETASYPKIAQIAAGGADVVTIQGSRQDVAEAALRQSAEIFYASHNWQPFFVEGIKTLAYELWEQLGFNAPDNIVVPLGYGSNVLGCRRGLCRTAAPRRDRPRPRDLRRAGGELRAVGRRLRGGRRTHRADRNRLTIAEGIATAKPTRVGEVLQGVRDSGGSIVAVEEAEIVDALRDLARRGLYVEPTSAVGAAGLSRLLSSAPSCRVSDGPRPDRLRPQGLDRIGELLKLAPRAE